MQITYQPEQALHSSGIVQQLDARTKVIISLGFILSNLMLPDGAWVSFVLATLIVFAYSTFANVRLGFMLRRSLIALPFLLTAITLLFTVPGQPIAHLPFGSGQLSITDNGAIRFFSIVLRSWLAVQVAIILTATTPFPELLNGLRTLGLPHILVAVIGLMYRYISVISDEAQRLLRAREARSACLPRSSSGGSLIWRAHVAGNLVGQLFVRSYERSERVYQAMLARGYTGELRSLTHPRMQRRDWAALLIAAGVLLLVQLTRFVG